MFASSLIYVPNFRLLHISLNVFCVSDHHLPTALVIQWLSISEIPLLSVLIGIHNFPCHSWDCFHNVNIVIILSLLAGVSVLGAGLSKVWLESATSVFLLCQHNAYFAGLGPWQLFCQSNISYPGHATNILFPLWSDLMALRKTGEVMLCICDPPGQLSAITCLKLLTSLFPSVAYICLKVLRGLHQPWLMGKYESKIKKGGHMASKNELSRNLMDQLSRSIPGKDTIVCDWQGVWLRDRSLKAAVGFAMCQKDYH